MSRLAAIFLAATLVSILSITSIVPSGAAAAPAGPKIGFFFPDPQRPDEELPSLADVQDFESAVGRQMDLFLWYESIGENFYDDAFRPLAQEGRAIQLAWEPHDFGRDPLSQPEYRLERITAGYHDSAIRRWARELRDFGYTVYFRPMCEMNGDWVTWGGTVNGNTPDDYIPAWRHVHDIFQQEGADNVKFVWAPNRDGSRTSAVNTWNTYYPGDAYVDYVGINGYNWGRLYDTPEWTSEWQMIEEVFGPSYDAFTARTNKPVIISETASTEVGGDKAAWITDAFAKLPVRFPKIEFITWFNIDKETDWRVESSTASFNAFRAAVAQSDTTAPTVSISSPQGGATLSGDVALSAAASDDQGLTKVDFYMGENLIATSTDAPYSATLSTRTLPNGSYTLSAKAYDQSGNTGTDQVSVSISNSNGTNYHLGWYDNVSMNSWLIISNPTEAGQTVEVYVGDSRMGTYNVGPQQRITPSYTGVADGPVKVVSTNGGELLVSERTIYNGTFAEVPAVPEEELSGEQLLAWYDESTPGMKNWVMISNQGSQTSQVDVLVAGELMGQYTVPAGEVIAPEFPGTINGPVQIKSTNGQPLLASSRVVFNGSFNELGATASSQLASEYHFTWYDHQSDGMNTWIVAANQGDQTAEVGVYIAGRLMGLYNIPAGGRITPSYANTMDGPVQVISTNGQPLIVGQRSFFKGSFEEVPGTNPERLTSEQWFSWYDSRSDGMNTWVMIGNESDETAEVDVLIAGNLMGHYSIPAGGRAVPKFADERNGPVQVVSTEGAPQLVVSQRTTLNNSFDELPGTRLN